MRKLVTLYNGVHVVVCDGVIWIFAEYLDQEWVSGDKVICIDEIHGLLEGCLGLHLKRLLLGRVGFENLPELKGVPACLLQRLHRCTDT